MKLWLALALVLLVGKGASQEAGKEVPLPSRKNPFILDAGFLQEGPQQPLRLHSLDLDLWKLATKVASEPPARPPGVGIGIGGPVGHLRIPLPPGQDGSGFEIDIYPRLAKKETGLMGISRVTEVAEHVTQRHYLGWFDHRELRKFCEAEGVRELAKRAQATPLLWFSMIEQKKGFPGVWVENLHVVNVSGQPLLIENVIFRVLKAGTTEELRKAEVVWPPKMKRVAGKRQFELLPQRTWLALSTEWNAVPDLANQSCSAWVRTHDDDSGGASFGIPAGVNRYVVAEVERH